MEKDPEKEIMVDPRWSYLQDGLGYTVLVVGGMEGTDKDGVEIVTFTIKPEDLVRKRYNLRFGKEIDINGNMKFIAAKRDLIPLNVFDDANKKWLYVKNFLHEPTDLSRREEELKRQLEISERKTLLLEADNLRLNEQLELARLNPGKFIKEGTEVFEQVSKAYSETMRKKDE